MKKIFTVFFIVTALFISCDDKTVTIYGQNDEDPSANTDPDNYSDESVQDEDSYIPDTQADPDSQQPDEIYYDPDVIDDYDSFQDADMPYNDTDAEQPDESSDPDSVSDEDTADCATIGQTVPVVPGAKECCKGLQTASIMEIVYSEYRGYCSPLDGASVCINCGNSVCDEGENICNCNEDCAEERNEMCDDGSTDLCDMMPPVDCEGSLVLAIINSCWACVDPLTCKATDRDVHCDDGTIPMCNMMPPTCSKSEILAYKNNCYDCVDPVTCK